MSFLIVIFFYVAGSHNDVPRYPRACLYLKNVFVLFAFVRQGLALQKVSNSQSLCLSLQHVGVTSLHCHTYTVLRLQPPKCQGHRQALSHTAECHFLPLSLEDKTFHVKCLKTNNHFGSLK